MHGAADQSRLESVDALRAVAVTAVLLFHWFPNQLPGGYLGVDAFFVISGFVVTRNNQTRARDGAWEFLKQFYRRRFFRIFPSLAVVTLIGLILVVGFDPQPIASIRTGLAGLVGVANVEILAQQSNYFVEQEGTNAFVHYWSLGVEEQFYLVYPLVMLLTIRLRGVIRFVPLAACTGSSLGAYLLLIHHGMEETAFYMFPFRFWEIGIGGLVALTGSWHFSTRTVFLRWSLVGVLGSISVVFIAQPRSGQLSTIFVVATTALLLYLARSGSPSRGVAQRALALVGRRSYSLYLVHWVLLVVWRITVGVDGRTIPVLIGATLVLSELNYRVVERRFLGSSDKISIQLPLVVFSAGVLVLISAIVVTETNFLFLGNRDAISKPMPRATCISPDSSRWLVGDSHADRYSQILGTHFDRDCVQIRDSTTGYGFLFDLKGAELRTVEFRDATPFLDRVRREHPSEIWIVNYMQGMFQDPSQSYSSADWTIDGFILPDGSRIDDRSESLAYLISAYERLLVVAREVGATVFIELPPPDFDWVGQGGLLWRNEEALCEASWFNLDRSPQDARICIAYSNPAVVARHVVESRRRFIVDQLRALDDEFQNLVLLDPLPILCSSSTCSTHLDGIRLFEDDDHYSVNGQLLIAEHLDDMVG